MGDVRALRPTVPLAGEPGPLDARWSASIDPATDRWRVRAHDSATGVLILSLELRHLAGNLDAGVVAKLVARIVGEFDEGAADLMYAEIKGGRL